MRVQVPPRLLTYGDLSRRKRLTGRNRGVLFMNGPQLTGLKDFRVLHTMALHDSNREDLLREATALVERVEFTIPPGTDPIVVGFRRNGAASFFFGDDPVYQFNSDQELRRAFVAGRLYKAESGSLVQLDRQRTATESLLMRRKLSPDEMTDFLGSIQRQMCELQAAISQHTVQIIGQVPPTADIIGRIEKWLAALPNTVVIAQAANVAKRI